MEEQTKSTRTMRIVLGVVLGMVVVAGILAALFYTPPVEGVADSNDGIEQSADLYETATPSNDTKEAAPF